uniref:Cytochrome P450 n=1 Tax=Kalanchoe fedtschenkoi TaxID=63787 RepID=A0A7N0UEJ9_KALFE
MELSLITSSIALLAVIYFIRRILFKSTANLSSPGNLPLPPGSLGWPLIGETLEFSKTAGKGVPEKFVMERVAKHKSEVIKTHLLGETVIVLSGQAGNKFLFGNENKLVRAWWPAPLRRLFGDCLITSRSAEDAVRVRSKLMTFLNPTALKSYVDTIDTVSRDHFKTHWSGRDELKVQPTVKQYAFDLALRLFMGKDDPQCISQFTAKFNVFAKGLLEFPIDLPGTRFNGAMKAAEAMRKEIKAIISQRRADMRNKQASPPQDLLSHLLAQGGKSMAEAELIGNLLLVLYSSHDTGSSLIASLISCLAKFPQVYESVLQEQMDIAATKGPGELLHWDDIQQMRYSWLVASEVLRLRSPATGTFREVLSDFEYAGYKIPKGCKMYISIGSTHKNPSLFPEPEEFNPSRFEGAGPAPYSYVPFGGGPRMCPGIEFAKLETLVFLHNLVKNFKWELKNADEKFGYDEYVLTHYDGLPVKLKPRLL